MQRVSCLTLLSTRELKDESMYLNQNGDRIMRLPVIGLNLTEAQIEHRRKLWFDCAWQDIQVGSEIERRWRLFNKPREPKLRSTPDIDVSNLKRLDYKSWPNQKLARLTAKLAVSAKRTIEKHGETVDRPVYIDLKDASLSATDWLKNPKDSKAVLIRVTGAICDLEHQELKSGKECSFRVVLNKRISLLSECAKRMEVESILEKP